MKNLIKYAALAGLLAGGAQALLASEGLAQYTQTCTGVKTYCQQWCPSCTTSTCTLLGEQGTAVCANDSNGDVKRVAAMSDDKNDRVICMASAWDINGACCAHTQYTQGDTVYATCSNGNHVFRKQVSCRTQYE